MRFSLFSQMQFKVRVVHEAVIGNASVSALYLGLGKKKKKDMYFLRLLKAKLAR